MVTEVDFDSKIKIKEPLQVRDQITSINNNPSFYIIQARFQFFFFTLLRTISLNARLLSLPAKCKSHIKFLKLVLINLAFTETEIKVLFDFKL